MFVALEHIDLQSDGLWKTWSRLLWYVHLVFFEIQFKTRLHNQTNLHTRKKVKQKLIFDV